MSSHERSHTKLAMVGLHADTYLADTSPFNIRCALFDGVLVNFFVKAVKLESFILTHMQFFFAAAKLYVYK
jgi:hypothetical protein